MSELKVNRLAHIQYTKVDMDGDIETTHRVIVPTYVPSENIKALDVSDLKPLEAMELRMLMEEYTTYVESKTKTIFNFEDWLDHTGQKSYDLKWRTFKPEQTHVIKVEEEQS